MKRSLLLLALCTAPATLAAQTLRGSPASVDLMYTSARNKDLAFLNSRGDIWQAATSGELAMFSVNENLTLDHVNFPFVLPNTLRFTNNLAAVFRKSCGERLVVTSGSRPEEEQPRNASPKSVHPTGMAVDFRKPRDANCLAWLRANLLDLENRHIIEATEEMHPPHFHVAVLQQPAHAPTLIAEASAPLATKAAPKVQTVGGEVAGIGVSQTVSPNPPAANATGHVYTVRAGDNLWGIARRNGTTPEKIKQLNGLTSTRLRVGQQLQLP
ncbi:MAG TPA: DUF5715 family protein [Gemmatimonadaceae bacterium]